MSWGMHEAAKKLASGWYSELDTTRKTNADLERENAKLRELFAEIWPIAEYAGYEHELSRARELMRELGMEVD